MKPKLTRVLIVMIGLCLVVVAGGCKHRRFEPASAAGSGKPDEFIAPSNPTKDGKEPTFSIVDKGDQEVDLAQREEIRRAYKLEPGTQVTVNNINGRIDVETADTETAEVLIIRSAKKREDLEFRKTMIEHSPRRLQIGVVNDRKSVWSALGSIPEIRQRVMLRLPRKIEFGAHRLNGPLTVGQIDGKVWVDNTNGEIKIEQSTGEAAFHGINGNIEATIAKLSGKGINIGGINGNTTLRFIGDVNADIESRGMNGRIEPDFQNIDIQKNEGFGRYNARIGSGGVRIEVHGVNGNVYLGKAEKTAADSSKAPAKTDSTK